MLVGSLAALYDMVYCQIINDLYIFLKCKDMVGKPGTLDQKYHKPLKQIPISQIRISTNLKLLRL